MTPGRVTTARGSHVSYPFEGVSAQAMAAAILARSEGNADLADRDEADVSPPPICLEARDLRDGYEVTTPECFWIALNWLYHAMTAETLFARFRAEVEAGAEAAIARFAEQAARYGRMIGASAGVVPTEPRIWTVAKLKETASHAIGGGLAARYAAEEAKLTGVDNPLAITRHLTEWLVEAGGIQGPAVVIGFAGLNYPSSRLDATRAEDRRLRAAIDAARAPLAGDP